MNVIAIIAVVAVAVLSLLAVVAVCAFSPRHKLRQWLSVEANIRTLTSENLTEQPPQIQKVLRLVLTPTPGVGNLAAIKGVREALALELDMLPRGLRACASGTVLFGLFCTVAALAYAFFNISAPKPEPIVAAISAVLPGLYFPNTLAILVALVLTVVQTVVRHRNDRILLVIDDAFNQLQAPNEGVDPRLVAAMTEVSRKMQSWQTEISDSYLQQIRLLLDQVTRVAEGIQSLVKEGLAAAREDDDSVLLAVTTLSRRIESQNQRLDAAIHRLVGPVSSGFTGLSGMTDVAAGLKDVVGTLGTIDLREPLERVGNAATAMNESLTNLPKDIEGAISSIGDKWGDGVATAVSGALASNRGDLAHPLNEMRDAIVERLSEIIRIAASYRDSALPGRVSAHAPLVPAYAHAPLGGAPEPRRAQPLDRQSATPPLPRPQVHDARSGESAPYREQPSAVPLTHQPAATAIPPRAPSEPRAAVVQRPPLAASPARETSSPQPSAPSASWLKRIFRGGRA